MCTWDFSTLFVGNTKSSCTHVGLGIVPPAPFKWFFSSPQVVSLYTRRPWRFPQLLLCEDLLSLVLCPVDSSWFGLSKIPTLSLNLERLSVSSVPLFVPWCGSSFSMFWYSVGHSELVIYFWELLVYIASEDLEVKYVKKGLQREKRKILS